MNKKIFKRLLIATSMIAPVVMVTPMILTSCSEGNSNTSQGIDKNAIQLSNISSLFKERTKAEAGNDFLFGDDITGLNNHFWLDSIHIKNDDLTIESQVKKLVDGLIVDKQNSIINLKNQKFDIFKKNGTSYEQIKEITNDEYLENDLLFKKSTYSSKDDLANLKTVFGDVFLSNRVFNSTAQTENKDDNSLVINGSLLNIEQLLEKTDIQSRIKIIDTQQKDVDNASINDVRNTNNFIIQYYFKPKNGMYWDGIKDNNKKIMPLIITIKDNVDEIELVKDLDKFNKDSTSLLIPFTASSDIVVDSGKTFDVQYVGEKLLGITDLAEITSSSTAKVVDPTTSSKILSEFLKNSKINGKVGSGSSVVEFIPDNLHNAFSKKRVKIEITEVTKDPSTGDITDVNVKLKISLVNSVTGRSIPDYEWKTQDVIENKNVLPIEISLNVKKTASPTS